VPTNFGIDTFCLTDVGLTDVLVTDPRILVGQRVARALQTPHGALALIGGDPNRGFDVRTLLKKKMSPADISQAQAQIKAEAEKDEAVQSANVALTFFSGKLTVAVDLIGAMGPFSLVLTVGQLTTAQIFVS
jgi:hypothetical protein